MKKFLSIALAAALSVAVLGAVAEARTIYVVKLVRADGSISAQNTYYTNSAAQAKAQEWRDAIEDGACTGCHVETNIGDDGQGPLDPNQN